LNILVLSPHRDDAAFSLALAIKGWLAAGHRVTVLGVFTRSLSAPYSDADTVHPNDLLSYVSAMRRREDAEFLKLLPGLRMVDLNLKDALLRLRCTDAEVYTLPSNPEDTAIAKIHKALSKQDADQAIDAILLPLALGHHVDHRVVRDAALSFAASHACAFYEDLPDGIADDGVEIADAVRSELASLRDAKLFAEELTPIVLRAGADDPASAAAAKRRIVSVYASQIDDATIDMISRFSQRYDGGERVWASSGWPV
jgi:LmbE family N-acetylglucosaminyl deacetylase